MPPLTQVSRPGATSGPAGGDLTGTYPNPLIAPLAVTDAKVATANKDGLAGVPSMRTLGSGALQACAGNDARLSDARTPTGPAGGGLSGTYPNPTVTSVGGAFGGEVNGNNQVSTSGAGYVVVPGMTITPPAGTYMVWFNANARTDTAGRWAEIAIQPGAQPVVAYSLREVPGTSYSTVACTALVTVNGAEAITAVYRRNSGPAGPNSFIRERQLSILRTA